MEQPVQLRGETQSERQQYLAFLYIGGTGFLLLLIISIVLQELYSAAGAFIISKPVDNIMFQIAETISTTGFGAAVIGVIIDQYQRRFVEAQERLVRFVSDEGIIEVFPSANDPRLQQYLFSLLRTTRSEIVAVGLGLGVLANNSELLRTMGQRMTEAKSLRIDIFLGGPDNPGMQARIAEEREWHAQHKLNYDQTWVVRFPREIESFIKGGASSEAASRLRVIIVDELPMIAIFRFDDRLLVFPYGSPNIRGSQSPWLVLDGRATNSHLVKFCTETLDYFSAKYARDSTFDVAPNPNT